MITRFDAPQVPHSSEKTVQQEIGSGSVERVVNRLLLITKDGGQKNIKALLTEEEETSLFSQETEMKVITDFCNMLRENGLLQIMSAIQYLYEAETSTAEITMQLLHDPIKDKLNTENARALLRALVRPCGVEIKIVNADFARNNQGYETEQKYAVTLTFYRSENEIGNKPEENPSRPGIFKRIVNIFK